MFVSILLYLEHTFLVVTEGVRKEGEQSNELH